MYSGWEARLDDPASFINQDGAGVPHFPGFHPDAAALLVNERDIVAIGVDTVSLDFGASTDFKTHLTVLPAGKYGLENLAALATVPPSGATIIVGGAEAHQRVWRPDPGVCRLLEGGCKSSASTGRGGWRPTRFTPNMLAAAQAARTVLH
jgi:Putative cyclase